MNRITEGRVFNALGAVLCALVLYVYWPSRPAALPTTPMSTVKVLVDSGHGSGVHIGGGLFLTAQHVIDKENKVEVKTSNGSIAPARVLWSTTGFDVALLYAPEASYLPSSPLVCAPLAQGEAVYSTGNPRNLEFATIHGRVAGETKRFEELGGAILTPLDMTVVGGMSGGPLFDTKGRVRGLIDAVMMTGTGGFGGAAPVAIGYAVPSWVICTLMGKKD